MATPKGPSGCNGAQRKSYAAAILGASGGPPPPEPSSAGADPTPQESAVGEKKGAYVNKLK